MENPPNTKFLEMDKLGHIIQPQFAENELMLNANSQLLIKKRNGMIIAKVIN